MFRTYKAILILTSIAFLTAILVVLCIHPWSAGDPRRSPSHSQATTTSTEVSGAWDKLIQIPRARNPFDVRPYVASRRAFDILRGTPERMPDRMQAHVAATLHWSPQNLPVGSAQYGRTDQGGLWILSGQRVTCIIQAKGGAVACGMTSRFVRHGLSVGVATPAENPRDGLQSFLILGAAPDRIKRIHLKIGERDTFVSVHGNVYAIRANKPIALELREG